LILWGTVLLLNQQVGVAIEELEKSLWQIIDGDWSCRTGDDERWGGNCCNRGGGSWDPEHDL
jgi:hypothetical protein